MTSTIKEVMTPDPITLTADSTALDAAKAMKKADVGDVIVTDGGALCGIVTDRDITVRVVAEGKDSAKFQLRECCTRDLTTLSPDDSVADAVRLMREKNIRRLPVVEGGKPVGIVTIGDLALAQDPQSALADISSAPPNN
jgi:CBS domain-containing protein